MLKAQSDKVNKPNNSNTILLMIDKIETEMKRIDYWVDNPPNLEADVASGTIRSFLDAPSFELWLQCIFIPNVKRAVKNDNLPAESQVGFMAMKQYHYHSIVEAAQPLLSLLHEFDNLIVNH